MKSRHLFAIGLVLFLALGDSGSAQRYTVSNTTSSDRTQIPLILLTDTVAQIQAAIAPEKGGELSGLQVQFHGKWIEALYLARDYSPRDGWTGKAPLLWPATGRNFPPDLEARQRAGERFSTGAYELDGQRYEMPIHGFARDLVWNVEETAASVDGAFASLAVKDSPATRKRYPFGFRLEVNYGIAEGRLSMKYRVEADATNRRAMPFSIGNHITFVSPLIPTTKPGQIELVTPSRTELLKTKFGIPTGKNRPRSHANPVRLADFERLSAVSLTGYDGDPYIYYRDPQGLAIRMSHSASEYPAAPVVLYNIWGDAEAGFFSPEPWVGLQNSLVTGQGLIRLDPGAAFNWTIRLELERN